MTENTDTTLETRLREFASADKHIKKETGAKVPVLQVETPEDAGEGLIRKVNDLNALLNGMHALATWSADRSRAPFDKFNARNPKTIDTLEAEAEIASALCEIMRPLTSDPKPDDQDTLNQIYNEISQTAYGTRKVVDPEESVRFEKAVIALTPFQIDLALGAMQGIRHDTKNALANIYFQLKDGRLRERLRNDQSNRDIVNSSIRHIGSYAKLAEEVTRSGFPKEEICASGIENLIAKNLKFPNGPNSIKVVPQENDPEALRVTTTFSGVLLERIVAGVVSNTKKSFDLRDKRLANQGIKDLPGREVKWRLKCLDAEDSKDGKPKLVIEIFSNDAGIPPEIVESGFTGGSNWGETEGESKKGEGVGMRELTEIMQDHYEGDIIPRNNDQGGSLLQVVLPLKK